MGACADCGGSDRFSALASESDTGGNRANQVSFYAREAVVLPLPLDPVLCPNPMNFEPQTSGAVPG